MKSLTRQNFYSLSLTMLAQAPVKLTGGFLFMTYSFFYDPLKTQLYFAVATLIIFDFFTALIATVKTKEKITSAKASRTLVKLIVYGILISASVLVDRFVLQVGQVFADLTLGFVAVTEFISILENISKTGYSIPLQLLSNLKKIQKNK